MKLSNNSALKILFIIIISSVIEECYGKALNGTSNAHVSPIVPRQSNINFPQKNNLETSKNVYRFELNGDKKSPLHAPSSMVVTSGPRYASTMLKRINHKNSLQIFPNGKTTTTANNNNDNNDNKNWLLTKAWLIDNINRLRKELSELQRDYSHFDNNHRENMEKQKHLMEDVAKLRADHLFLSQQQKQIFYLIKKGKYFQKKSNDLKFAVTKIPDATQPRKPIKRDLTSTLSNFAKGITHDEKFVTETRQNIKEVFAELSSLHDISLTLFDEIKLLERRMEITNKLLK